MSSIALIPARSNSRRIPRKCIRDFCGLPMLAHPIRTARETGLFDRVIVSTDDEETAAVARKYGAEVPFLRPAALADDHTPVVEVVRHAIRTLQGQGCGFDFLCRIFATAVLIAPEDLRQGYDLMRGGARFSMGVKSFPHPIERAIRLDERGNVHMLHREKFSGRTQDQPATYYDPGQFCWGSPGAFLSGLPPLLSEGTAAVVLPPLRGLDIDNEEDWQFAEAIWEFTRRTPPPATPPSQP